MSTATRLGSAGWRGQDAAKYRGNSHGWATEIGYPGLLAATAVVAAYVTAAAAEQRPNGTFGIGRRRLTQWVSSINQVHAAADLDPPGRSELGPSGVARDPPDPGGPAGAVGAAAVGGHSGSGGLAGDGGGVGRRGWPPAATPPCCRWGSPAPSAAPS